MSGINPYIDNSWKYLLERISNEEQVDLGSINLTNLFDSEKNLNDARRVLGKEKFKALQRHYLETLDPDFLKQKISEHESVFKRYLGPDRFYHLKLVVSLKSAIGKKKKGLLATA